AEARPRGRQPDTVIHLLLGRGDGVEQAHPGAARVAGVHLVADGGSLLGPGGVAEPAPTSYLQGFCLQDAFPHPLVGIQLAAVLNGGLLGRSPPVVAVAASRSAHGAVPLSPYDYS